MVQEGKGKSRLEKWVFWPPLILLLGVVILSFVAYDAFVDMMYNGFAFVTDNFGWVAGLLTLSIMSILLFLLVSKKGSVKFGGKDAVPDFTNWHWFAMSLCAGIAIGIVFWGVCEPIQHMMEPAPAYGLEPGSAGASINALATVFVHWTTPYALYVLAGVAIALAYYNHHQPFAVSSSLYFLVGEKRSRGWIGKLVDCLSVFAIVCAVTSSLGFGAMQLGSGLEYIFGIHTGKVAWGVILVVVSIAFILSAYTGVEKGIKFLSNQNLKIYIFVLIIVIIFGPSTQAANIGLESFGNYIGNLIEKMTFMDSFAESRWTPWWTTFFYFAWMAYAPVTGMFLARLGKGRTVRQFIIMNFIAPSLFGIIWFALFGGSAIWMQTTGAEDFWSIIGEKGMEAATFAFLLHLPLGKVMIAIFCVAIFVSFVTCADSMTNCTASMCTKGIEFTDQKTEEAPAFIKIIWGLMIMVLSWVMMSFAGLDGIKWLCNINGFPVMILMIFITISFVKGLFFPDIKFIKWKKKSASGGVAESGTEEISSAS